jgi:hypothetical protein
MPLVISPLALEKKPFQFWWGNLNSCRSYFITAVTFNSIIKMTHFHSNVAKKSRKTKEKSSLMADTNHQGGT